MIENQLEKLIELNTEIARQLLVIANTVQEAVDFPSGADGADSAQQPAGKRTRRGGSKNAAAADTAGAAAATAGQTVNADPNAQPAQQPTASQAPAAPPVESSPATVVGTGGPTVEDVRKAASAYSLVLEKSGMADEPRKALIASVLKPLGANALAELNPAMFGAAIALFQSAAATAAPAPQPVAAGNGLGI